MRRSPVRFFFCAYLRILTFVIRISKLVRHAFTRKQKDTLIVSSFLHFNQKRTTSINEAVEFWPVEFWNTTTARPLSGLNLTVSTGPPLFLGLSKNSSMASWVVSSEMLLTRMLLHTGTCWIVTRAESIPLFSPFSLILRKSNEYMVRKICFNYTNTSEAFLLFSLHPRWVITPVHP